MGGVGDSEDLPLYEKGGGGAKSFHPLKGWRKKFWPVLRGRGKKFRVRHFPIL